MLNTPAPFPLFGSWALLERDGETLAVRIVGLELAEMNDAILSVAGRPGASARIRADFDELLDPTPLSAAERAEHADLMHKLSGRKRGPAGAADRFAALDARLGRAETLERILAGLPRRRLATPATNAALAMLRAARDSEPAERKAA